MTDQHTDATPPSSLKIYLRLLGYVRPYIGMFLISILGYIIFASTQPMLAGILKYFVDGLSDSQAVLFPSVPMYLAAALWLGFGKHPGEHWRKYGDGDGAVG